MSHRICPELRQKFKKGAPSARHYAPFQVEYLPLFSARVARSKAIGFKKNLVFPDRPFLESTQSLRLPSSKSKRPYFAGRIQRLNWLVPFTFTKA